MSIGVLSKTQDRFLVEESMSITSDFVSLEIAVRELGESSAIILRTFNDGRAKPRLEIKHLSLEPQTVAPQEQLKVDPSACPQGDRKLQQFPEQLPAGWEDPLEKLRSKWLVVPSGNDLRRSSAHLLTCDDATLLGHWGDYARSRYPRDRARHPRLVP
jgi:hypothetical protein